MIGLVILLVLVTGMAVLLWWTVGQPPTRPRPGSRYRGRTYLDVHNRLRRPRR